MDRAELSAPAAWRVADLADQSWTHRLDDAASRQMADAVKAVFEPERSLFEYRRDDFDFAAIPTLAAAVREAHHGRGLALVKNLPRAHLSDSAGGLGVLGYLHAANKEGAMSSQTKLLIL